MKKQTKNNFLKRSEREKHNEKNVRLSFKLYLKTQKESKNQNHEIEVNKDFINTKTTSINTFLSDHLNFLQTQFKFLTNNPCFVSFFHCRISRKDYNLYRDENMIEKWNHNSEMFW